LKKKNGGPHPNEKKKKGLKSLKGGEKESIPARNQGRSTITK